jgi:hypothetical protein
MAPEACRGEHFTMSENKTLSVAAMSVNNPHRLPVGINRMASSQRVMFSGAKHL